MSRAHCELYIFELGFVGISLITYVSSSNKIPGFNNARLQLQYSIVNFSDLTALFYGFGKWAELALPLKLLIFLGSFLPTLLTFLMEKDWYILGRKIDHISLITISLSSNAFFSLEVLCPSQHIDIANKKEVNQMLSLLSQSKFWMNHRAARNQPTITSGIPPVAVGTKRMAWTSISKKYIGL